MASFLPAWFSPKRLRDKFVQTVILLVISLLIINWYFLGKGKFWNNKVKLEKTDTHMKAVVDKDIQMIETRLSFYRSPLAPHIQNNRTLTIKGLLKTYLSATVTPSSIPTHSEEETEEDPTTESPRRCPNLSLQYRTNNAEYGLCTPHKPSEYSCEFAQKMYFVRSELSKCKKKQMGDICKMEVNKTSEGKAIKFICSKTLCKQGENDSFKVHSVNPTTGLTHIVKKFTTIKKLERGLPAISRRNKQNKFNFVFIECTNHEGKKISQFLPVEPHFTIEETNKIINKNFININVLLIDSLSRAHFYRSLPRTVATFKNWQENPRAVPAKVFDFELFQAVHGHTAVNMHAFYTGELFPVELKDKTPPVNISALFGRYKRAGFQTVWQEDLCWQGYWGLMTDLGVGDWGSLQTEMKSNYIDHTGLTHSSCKILKSLGIDSPFNGPDGNQICYNGKFQHTYFLRYITDTLQAVSASRNARPILLYTVLNVAHDQRSIRTQTLDVDLQSYVTSVANDENTLTIILADHGNTYTSYTSEMLEGRFEMFHPSLFVIVPNRVASLLGKNAMSALEINQRRLVTMVDLHHSLMALAAPLRGAKPVGVFTPISKERTCDDLELRTPNLCACEGWDIPADNDTGRIPIVEFAIGELNNRLHEQYNKVFSLRQNTQDDAEMIKRSCERLQPLWFENVRERNSKTDGSLITSMDIRVTAGDVVSQQQDIFHVEVKTKEISGQRSLDMTLLTYDRLTLFGKYKMCADDGVELKLCVCSRNASKISLAFESPERWEHFGQRPVLKNISNKPCLWLMIRRYSKANSYEVANFCPDQSFRVKVDAEASNMKFFRQLPLTLDVKPGGVIFAFSVGKHLSYWEAEISVTATVENESGYETTTVKPNLRNHIWLNTTN